MDKYGFIGNVTKVKTQPKIQPAKKTLIQARYQNLTTISEDQVDAPPGLTSEVPQVNLTRSDKNWPKMGDLKPRVIKQQPTLVAPKNKRSEDPPRIWTPSGTRPSQNVATAIGLTKGAKNAAKANLGKDYAKVCIGVRARTC